MCLTLCSQIYCSGDVLHTIQMANIFKDSKDFVDMKLKEAEEVIVQKFQELKEQNGGNISSLNLKAFVDVSSRRCLRSLQMFSALTFPEIEILHLIFNVGIFWRIGFRIRYLETNRLDRLSEILEKSKGFQVETVWYEIE